MIFTPDGGRLPEQYDETEERAGTRYFSTGSFDRQHARASSQPNECENQAQVLRQKHNGQRLVDDQMGDGTTLFRSALVISSVMPEPASRQEHGPARPPMIPCWPTRHEEDGSGTGIRRGSRHSSDSARANRTACGCLRPRTGPAMKNGRMRRGLKYKPIHGQPLGADNALHGQGAPQHGT